MQIQRSILCAPAFEPVLDWHYANLNGPAFSVHLELPSHPALFGTQTTARLRQLGKLCNESEFTHHSTSTAVARKADQLTPELCRVDTLQASQLFVRFRHIYITSTTRHTGRCSKSRNHSMRLYDKNSRVCAPSNNTPQLGPRNNARSRASKQRTQSTHYN